MTDMMTLLACDDIVGAESMDHVVTWRTVLLFDSLSKLIIIAKLACKSFDNSYVIGPIYRK